jgi:hypothetical protein
MRSYNARRATRVLLGNLETSAASNE